MNIFIFSQCDKYKFFSSTNLDTTISQKFEFHYSITCVPLKKSHFCRIMNHHPHFTPDLLTIIISYIDFPNLLKFIIMHKIDSDTKFIIDASSHKINLYEFVEIMALFPKATFKGLHVCPTDYPLNASRIPSTDCPLNLSKAFPHLYHLTHITISGISDASSGIDNMFCCPKLISHLSQLAHLSSIIFHSINLKSDLVNVFPNLMSLKTLKIRSCVVDSFKSIHMCPNLHHLIVDGGAFILAQNR